MAVYLLDLDEFKEINDVLGHDVGDDMLVAVARRLSAIVRPTDTVARLGGDEFVVVCDIESGEEEMLRIAERISDALARPYRIDGRTLTVLASVGGVFADNADTDPSRLLSRADDAMYGVKWSRRRERRSMIGLTGRWTTADRSDPSSLRIALVCPYSLSRPGGVQGQVLGTGPGPAANGATGSPSSPRSTDRRMHPTGSTWWPPATRSRCRPTARSPR